MDSNIGEIGTIAGHWAPDSTDWWPYFSDQNICIAMSLSESVDQTFPRAFDRVVQVSIVIEQDLQSVIDGNVISLALTSNQK